jgi:hypothetical protein
MNRSIPALSIRQPFAWAILHAGKNVENREWATRYRGRIRIHAAKTWDEEGYEWLKNEGDCDTFLPAPYDPAWFPLGAYVGEVTVTNCVQYDTAFAAAENPWAFGPWCWVLADPIAYPEPIPGRGYPGLYLPERFERT